MYSVFHVFYVYLSIKDYFTFLNVVLFYETASTGFGRPSNQRKIDHNGQILKYLFHMRTTLRASMVRDLLPLSQICA